MPNFQTSGIQFGAKPKPLTPLATAPKIPGTTTLGTTPPNLQNTPAQNAQPAGQPIDPVDVKIGAPTLNSFQEYQDAALNQAKRSLDPMWESNQKQFEQTMINKGLSPGTEAYNNALDQLNRAKTDAYSQAQDFALQQGQRAQQQAFQQNFSESELANMLLRSREGNDTSVNVAGIGADTARYNADIGRNNFLDQLGFNQQQLGDDRNRWEQQFGLGQQNSDFNQMMQMMGFDRDTTSMNNGANNQDIQRAMALFGLMPQAQGSAPVDYLGALGQNLNQQNQNYQTGVNNANQQNASYMQLLSMFCDEEIKDIGESVEIEKCLDIVNSLPLVNFTYKADAEKTKCVGTTAQAFNTALHGEPAPVIKIIDMLGVILGSIQAQSKRIEALEANV